MRDKEFGGASLRRSDLFNCGRPSKLRRFEGNVVVAEGAKLVAGFEPLGPRGLNNIESWRSDEIQGYVRDNR